MDNGLLEVVVKAAMDRFIRTMVKTALREGWIDSTEVDKYGESVAKASFKFKTPKSLAKKLKGF